MRGPLILYRIIAPDGKVYVNSSHDGFSEIVEREKKNFGESATVELVETVQKKKPDKPGS